MRTLFRRARNAIGRGINFITGRRPPDVVRPSVAAGRSSGS